MSDFPDFRSSDFRSSEFLRAHIRDTMAFYHPHCLDPAGGCFHYYKDDGTIYDRSHRHLVSSARFVFDYVGADTAIAVNRLLKEGARVVFERPSQVAVTGTTRERIDALAKEFALNVAATQPPANPAADLSESSALLIRPPRIARSVTSPRALS